MKGHLNICIWLLSFVFGAEFATIIPKVEVLGSLCVTWAGLETERGGGGGGVKRK